MQALKLHRERLEMEKLLAAEEQKRREKMLQEIASRQEARRARNAAKLEASLAKKEWEAEQERKALEAERSIQASLLSAPIQSSGVWEKQRALTWTYRNASKEEMTSVSTFDEAKALFADTRGTEARTMLQRRWRAITGLELTKDHPVMSGAKDETDAG